METEKEMETVKIRTLKGRIITLTISQRTTTHLHGLDKFGNTTIIALKDIDSLFPMEATNDS